VSAPERRRFLGKFRGVVTDNLDPLMVGRVRARVPDVFGDRESGWALPCAPFGGNQTGFFAVPAKDAGVWIEFEHGDPELPVWSGCWWDTAAEMPPTLLAPPPPGGKVMVRTEGGHTVLLDDTPGTGGIVLETSGGQKVSMTSMGIEIDNGSGVKISMQGPQLKVEATTIEIANATGASIALQGPSVSVNSGALEVT
jgi:uncharacterized protein involved in type VI secretion and phage assembly